MGDSGFAALNLLYLVSGTPRGDLFTRLRLETQVYNLAPNRNAGHIARPRVKGARRPSTK